MINRLGEQRGFFLSRSQVPLGNAPRSKCPWGAYRAYNNIYTSQRKALEREIGFSWQIVLGTIVAFIIMQLGTTSGADNE